MVPVTKSAPLLTLRYADVKTAHFTRTVSGTVTVQATGEPKEGFGNTGLTSPLSGMGVAAGSAVSVDVGSEVSVGVGV